MKNGLDKKYLRDPDGGIHVLRKKAEAGILTQSEPQALKDFPSEGYSSNLATIPKVTFGTIWRYMIETVACKKQIATAKPLVKGYNFFMSNHVLAMYYLKKDQKHYIKSQVLPSMIKNKVYSCFIKVSSLGIVLCAKCGCPAGVDGRCNHVAATLFALDSLHKKNVTKQKEADVSCTSKACSWSVPKKRQGPVQPISSMTFKKHDYGKNKKSVQPMFKPGADVRAPHQQQWSQEKLQSMLNQLQEIQQHSGQAIGWCHILPQEVPAENSPITSNQQQSQDSTDQGDPLEVISPIKACESPISLHGIQQRCERVKKKLFVTPEKIKEIESKTREQSDSALWHFHRKCRITASKCYRAAVMKSTTSPTKAVHEMLYSKLKPTRQMREGLAQEPGIMALYIEKQAQSGHEGLSVSVSGLVISKNEGFLAASPDGIVHDPSVTDQKELLEMKYVQTNSSEDLKDALVHKRMCVKASSGVTINRNHK